MYGCESWTVKKAERWRIDAFELWCWRRLLRVPWTARRSNQSILKETSPGCSLEDWCWSWNSNTLATSCEELSHWKRLWRWKGLGAGGEGDDRGWDGWIASTTRWTWVWVNSGCWWWTGRPGVLQFMGSQRVGHDLSDWTELNHLPNTNLTSKKLWDGQKKKGYFNGEKGSPIIKDGCPQEFFNNLALPCDFSKCQCDQGSPFLRI